MVGIAVMTIVYFAVLAAAVLWVATFWTVRRARVRSVSLAHYVFGVLLLGFTVALLLRVPLLAIALLALVGLGLRDPRIRETSVRWWEEVREAQAQRRWASSAKDGQDLGPGVRYKLRAAGGHVYLGSKWGRWVTAHPEHAVLVLGPPREGKTSSIVIPTLLAARGPVLVTSTKPDVMAHTMAVRAELGTCWLFDPSGTTPCPPGAQRLHWSPVVACGSWDRTIRLTHDMVATARPADDSRDGGHWSERAAALLAAFLHAAALDGRGMRDVVGWVLRQDGLTPHRILNASGASCIARGGWCRASWPERS